jgi:hypothetical protein
MSTNEQEYWKLIEQILASHYKVPTKLVLLYCLDQWQTVQDGTALSQRTIRKAIRDLIQK